MLWDVGILCVADVSELQVKVRCEQRGTRKHNDVEHCGRDDEMTLQIGKELEAWSSKSVPREVRKM